jgi:hypothetical protein
VYKPEAPTGKLKKRMPKKEKGNDKARKSR